MTFFLQVIILLISLYFATRIVTNRLITSRGAFFGAILTSSVYQIFWLTIFFINPVFPDWIALTIFAITLVLLILKYYEFGIFSSISLVMLSIASIFAIVAFRLVIIYLFFVPLPG